MFSSAKHTLYVWVKYCSFCFSLCVKMLHKTKTCIAFEKAKVSLLDCWCLFPFMRSSPVFFSTFLVVSMVTSQHFHHGFSLAFQFFFLLIPSQMPQKLLSLKIMFLIPYFYFTLFFVEVCCISSQFVWQYSAICFIVFLYNYHPLPRSVSSWRHPLTLLQTTAHFVSQSRITH